MLSIFVVYIRVCPKKIEAFIPIWDYMWIYIINYYKKFEEDQSFWRANSRGGRDARSGDNLSGGLNGGDQQKLPCL